MSEQGLSDTDMSMIEAISLGIDRGLSEMGANLRGCTPSMLAQYAVEQIRLTTDLLDPVGMRPDGTADPRVESGADALQALWDVPRQRSWDYSDAVLRAAIPSGVVRGDGQADK